MTKNEYYVYVARDSSGVVVYVGSGKGRRVEHVSNGKSHNKGLNYLHQKGECIIAEIVASGLSIDDARVQEQLLIDDTNPAFNKGVAASKTSIKEAAKRKQIEGLMSTEHFNKECAALSHLLLSVWSVTKDGRYLCAAFEASIAQNGRIAYFLNDLEVFVSHYGGNCNAHYRLPLRVLGKQQVYEASYETLCNLPFVEDITSGWFYRSAPVSNSLLHHHTCLLHFWDVRIPYLIEYTGKQQHINIRVEVSDY